MFIARVDSHVFEIDNEDNGFIVNGKPVLWDCSKVDEGYFHILIDNRSYRAEVVESDTARKRFTIKVNGRPYTVVLQDKFDVLLERMGMNGNVAAKVNHLRAPMPGLIIDLKVKQGDRVAAGDPLVILEAMKMENIIKAPGDATVRSVKVKMGEGVEKNQVLIEFNPA
jgi:acetyl/propionyl-CoA carboxylase alpha subunit